ncbi:RidA family protein [Roseicyclus sp.]|jgi:enamine deaminase RidA (YjgF/YER057c/UK114 family)|uniref:RidA family protein n=1 Tax=Roseicyclus sp. TaxID=1914329 RepID=UPI001BCD4770|nr:RidA family protein [Roseicyclus sp.]
MAGIIEARLAEMGIELAGPPPAPAANYVPYVVAGDLVFVSGQIPMTAAGLETLIKGRVGVDLDIAAGAAAARLCAINLLAQLKSACGGDLDRLVRVVKLTGFVNAPPEFGDQPKVVNGASDLLVEVLGDKGRHSRSAVSAGGLPFGCAVEVEGIFQIQPA